MADVAKVDPRSSASPRSYAKATRVAVARRRRRVRGHPRGHVVEMSASVESDDIAMFRTTVEIAFGVER